MSKLLLVSQFLNRQVTSQTLATYPIPRVLNHHYQVWKAIRPKMIVISTSLLQTDDYLTGQITLEVSKDLIFFLTNLVPRKRKNIYQPKSKNTSICLPIRLLKKIYVKSGRNCVETEFLFFSYNLFSFPQTFSVWHSVSAPEGQWSAWD